MRYLIAHMLASPAKEDIQRVIDRSALEHGSSGIGSGPHLTLKYSVEQEHLPALERSCAALAQEFPPIPYTIKGYGSFDDEIIFLRVQRDERMLRFQRRLRDLLADGNVPLRAIEEDGVNLHVTIARVAQGFASAWDAMTREPRRYDLTLDSIMIREKDGERSRPYRSFTLG